MQILFIVIAMAVGGLLPFQAAANRAFGLAAGSGWYAAIWNFVLGGTALVAITLVQLRSGTIASGPDISGLRTVPWWGWLGGLVGATLVFTALSLVHRIGAIALLGALAAGQIISAAIVDHFALVNVPERSLTPGRLLGLALLLGGVIVFALSDRAGEG
ncbi:MAG: DMT family transporter [Planctomycetota bacterium]